MSAHNITVESGTSVRLPTAGKYCDRDIVVSATGGSSDYLASRLNNTIKSYKNDEVETIPAYAFYGCTVLKSVAFPSCEDVRNDAFYNCVALINVELPNVISIKDSAFRLCIVLSSIDLPLLTSIASNAFRDCRKLQSIILRSQTVCTLGGNAFLSTLIASGAGYIYVPADLVESYKTATNWVTYANQIRAIEDYPEITGG